MSLSADLFEKLGAFYLGRPVDPESRAKEDTPFLYDPNDLLTHAVCVGMTGSGKTGLGIALLEEAAIDGIPAIIIDPKGDLANLALQFPELRPEDFRPWISEDAARREGVAPEAYAEAQAKLWREGLAKWGEDGERIRRLQQSAEVAVFTPGSTAGIPVSVVRSFAPPPVAIREDAELFSGQVETTVASLLGLLNISAEARGREVTFLSNLLASAWEKGETLELAELARRIQKPPFTQVGVMDLESFYPEKERFKLVLALNSLIASPGFALWREGLPLDVDAFLHNAQGKPRLAVFSIAHVGDAERMFFVSMLLSAVLSWMRQQSGTGSLRALLYMDEIFGYFPPSANPPSKLPLLTLMKQARAFGLGVVLATQNPVDLDYKGLSNAGTWFIGRLQTERDKGRLLDGLGGMGLDRAKIDRLLSGLGKRVFLMNNIHEGEPVLFESRWALSYLCGPLDREKLRALPRPSGLEVAAREAAPEAKEEEGASSAPPLLESVRQVYPADAQGALLAPGIVACAAIRYRDAKAKVDTTREVAYLAPFPEKEISGVDWAAAESVELEAFADHPPQSARWQAVPPAGLRKKSYDDWQRGFTAWVLEGQSLSLLECAEVGAVSEPGEDERDFRIRLGQALREARDARVATLRAKYGKQLETLNTRLKRAQEAMRVQEAQAGQARMQTFLSIGSALMSAFLGRKKLSAANVSRGATAARGVSRAMKEGGDVAAANERVETLEKEIATLEETLQQEVEALGEKLDPLTCELAPREVPASRVGTRVKWIALGWVSVG